MKKLMRMVTAGQEGNMFHFGMIASIKNSARKRRNAVDKKRKKNVGEKKRKKNVDEKKRRKNVDEKKRRKKNVDEKIIGRIITEVQN